MMRQAEIEEWLRLDQPEPEDNEPDDTFDNLWEGVTL